MSTTIDKTNAQYCYLDIDIDEKRSKLALAAAFVDGTDTRYGFSSKDLRKLGGSEICRLEEYISMDHDWKDRYTSLGAIQTRPPPNGNRIVLKLNWEASPLACQNFATICYNGSTSSPPIGISGKPLTYRNTTIHRIIPNFIVQGGDIIFGNGSGGESIWGKKFKDEKLGLNLKHDKRGILSMGNSGKNSNTSQFFITFDKAPQCDGKHVVFGEMISGFDILTELESVGSTDGDPTVPVNITACGLFDPLHTPGAGYWYDQPDDSFNGSSPVFQCTPRVLVVIPTSSVQQKFTAVLGTHAQIEFLSVNDNNVQEKILSRLEQFAVDVVLFAPSCKQYAPLSLPSCWTEIDSTLKLEDVVHVAKPIDALFVVRLSWIATKNWNLD